MCSVERTVFLTMPQVLDEGERMFCKRKIAFAKTSVSELWGSEMPSFEDHWAIPGSRTCKYFSSDRTALRAEWHLWHGRVG